MLHLPRLHAVFIFNVFTSSLLVLLLVIQSKTGMPALSGNFTCVLTMILPSSLSSIFLLHKTFFLVCS